MNEEFLAHCPVCASSSLTPIPRTSRDYPLFPGEDRYTRHSCTGCEGEFFFPRIPMDYVKAYEQTQHYQNTLGDEFIEREKGETIHCENHHRLYRSIIYRLMARLPARGSYLDIGAGCGFLLELARDLGYTPGGVEISPTARAAMARRLPEAPLWETLEAIPKDRRFGVISALEVVEHVPDPVVFLEALRSRLTEEGILLVSTPNLDRPFWKFGEIGGERRLLWDSTVWDCPPNHLSRFRTRTLREALTRAGFFHRFVGPVPVESEFFLSYGLGCDGYDFHLLRKLLNEYVFFPMTRAYPEVGFGLIGCASKEQGPGSETLKTFFDEALLWVGREHVKRMRPPFRWPRFKKTVARLLPRRIKTLMKQLAFAEDYS